MRVVFLNGWAASLKMQVRLKQFLPPDYELLILDDLYQFDLEGIVSKIDEMMIPDTILIGWSLGGMLALYYAHVCKGAHQPKGLIVLNASLCFLEKPDFHGGVKCADFNKLKELVQEENTQAFLRVFKHLLVTGSASIKEDRHFLAPIFNANSLPEWRVLSKGLHYLKNLDLRETLNSIESNILFIFGENDVLVNAAVNQNLLDTKVNADVATIPNMGHFPFGFYAKELVEIIVRYISAQEIGKS